MLSLLLLIYGKQTKTAGMTKQIKWTSKSAGMIQQLSSRFARFVAMGILLILIAGACTKTEEYRFDISYNKTTTQEFLMADAIFTDFFRMAHKASIDTQLIRTGQGLVDSAVVYLAGDTYVFDYGISKRCPDGSRRSGSFRIYWTAPLTDTGSYILIEPDSLKINEKNIYGEVEIQRNNSTSKPEITFRTKNGMIALNDIYNRHITYTSHYFLEFKKGFSTPHHPTDDVFRYYGTASGTSSEFDRYQYKIKDTLTLRYICRYPRGGSAELIMPDFEINTAELNYLKESECSSIVNVEFWGILPNGAKKKSEKLNLNIAY